MSGPPPPTFSSFPDLSQLRAQPEASSSKSAVPSFSSFPDLPSRDDSDGRNRSSKRRDEEERSHKHGSRKNDDDRERRHRRSSKEREKDRHKDKEDRRAKEKRRERERQEAKDLIAGVKISKSVRRDEEDVLELDRKRKKREEEEAKALAAEDDGSRWYDAPKAESARPSRDQRAALQAPTQVGFFIDTRPDLGNVMYGGLNAASIPIFSRAGYGHVVGLSEAFKIVRESEKRGKSLEIAPGGLSTTKTSSLSAVNSATDHLSKILLHTAAQKPVDHMADFLPLVSQQSQRPRMLSLYANYNDGTEQPLELDLDEDIELNEARRDSLETLDQRIQRETVEYERKLKENPTLINEWIKYSVLHLKRSPETADATHPRTVKITEANGTITLKILAKAMNAHPDNEFAPALHLAYLRSAETFWAPSKLTERWKWVLSDVAGRSEVDGITKMELWIKYVDWREGQGLGAVGGGEGAGGVDETIEVYIECLNMIRYGVIGGKQEELEENMLYLLQRACFFLRHAGFIERATAIYQAMLELTFFKPDRLRQPQVAWSDVDFWRSDLVAGLERFWDAEVARVGETGAPSWRAAEAGAPPAFRFSQPQTAVEIVAGENPFEQWYKAERHQERHAFRPALATDLDLDDEDPYRVILFADVEPFLFVLQSSEVRLQLAFSFLSFLGLPFAPPGATTASPAARDPHLHWSLTNNDSMRLRMWPTMEPFETNGVSATLETPFSSPVKSWLSDSSDQFARNGQWFRLLDAGELEHVDVDMARNVLRQLRPVIFDPAFTSVSFILEAALSPKNAAKMAKEALSVDRDNLILWNSYAKLAHQRGKVTEARTVYITALRAALTRLQEAVEQSRKEDAMWLEEDLETLWAGWAEMEFVEGHDLRCQEVLVHACGVKQDDLEREAADDYEHTRPAPDRILRAFKNLESNHQRTSHSHLVIRALMAYQYKSLDDALSLISMTVEALTTTPVNQEAALQLRAQLVYHHGLRGNLPAKLKRDVLEEAIQLFPNNTQFLSLYLWGETHGRVYGRVRSIVSQLVKVDDVGRAKGGVLAFLWGAWAEAKAAGSTFWAQNSNGQERVRVLLDRGINSAESRRSASLWKIYIEFEGLCGRIDKAKQLCYRAVAAVGGSKDIYMLPFTPAIRPAFTKQELKAWAELMTERGVRVRIPFDRYWSREEEVSEMEIDDGDEEPLDDELAFLRERQKLMPY